MSGPAQVAERLAFGYTRVSLAEQAQGVSLEVQRTRICAYAAAKGLNLAAVFVDAGISGKELDRPGLQQLLAQCAAGQAGHVIVWRLDRLTRRTRHLLGLVEDLFLARGIEIHSVSESLDTSTPHGRFVLTLFGGLAQMERETIAERTRAALAWKRVAGQPTSHAPLGFRSVGRREQMEPVIEELDVVRRILALRQAGRSYRGIARALNTEGVWTKRRAIWRHSTVAKIVAARDRYTAFLEPQCETDVWRSPATS
jgi:site-specific DNA recombinase